MNSVTAVVLLQAYHDRLGWLLKALEIGLAQHKAQDSDDEDEGQQTAYEVSFHAV